jgi:hypothetical protein
LIRSYVAETYVPSGRDVEPAATAERVRAAARALRREGREIRFLRSTFMPTDELCLLVFEAESSAVVGEAAERAAVEVERIVEVVE